MQQAIKKQEHLSFDEFVKNAFEHYQQQWKEQSYSNLTFLDSAEKHNVTNEKYPYITEDGSIITLRKSYNELPHFIIRHKNAADKIAVQSIVTDDYFSYNNGKIIYAGFKPDARW